ncbi:MAG: hemagglutinin-related protein [Marinobacter sp. T13-3]|nr:MAG: hemagglutinin-related protein [Marinobacter sp. T13-3]
MPTKTTHTSFRLSTLSIAIASILGAGSANVSAACPEEMGANGTYTATADCAGNDFAVRINNVAADTLTVDNNVTLAGNGLTGQADYGAVAFGTAGSGAPLPEYDSSLVSLINNGDILGEATNGVTGVGINLWGDFKSDGTILKTHIQELTNNGRISGEHGILMINAATIGTLRNNAGATIYGSTNGILASYGYSSAGIGTLINDGSISGGGNAITVAQSGGGSVTFDEIVNNGSIGKASDGTTYGISTASNGTITTLTNTGSIHGSQHGINNQGTITTINNYGTITGTNGKGIFNKGTITTLVNGQTNALQYNSNAPQKYYTYFSDSSTYGKVHFGLIDYTLDTYGLRIADGENWVDGTYEAVIDSGGALTINNFEPISGVTYRLVDRNGDGLIWDLVIGEVSESRVYDSTKSLRNTPAGPAAQVIDGDSTLLSHFANLTTEKQLSDAATQVLPLLTGATPQVIVNAMGNTNRVVRARQAVNRGMNSGDTLMTEKHVWAKIYGTQHNQDDRDNVTGYDGHSKGMVFGLDGDLNNGTQLGAAFAYGNTNVTSNTNLNSAEIDSYQLVGYGSYDVNDRMEVSAQADLGMSKTDGERTMVSPVTGKAHADYDSTSVHLGAGIVRDFDLSARTEIAPTARIDYTRVDSDSYTETGSTAVNPFLNRVESTTVEALELGLGAELDHQISDNTRLEADLAVAYDTINEASTITSSFVGGGASFTTTGIKPDPWITRAGLGFTTSLQGGAEISARYDAETRSDFLDQTASLEVRQAF